MRADLRLKDLQGREPRASKLMNVKIPAGVAAAIEHVAKKLGTSKTDVVIALLNEGLDLTAKHLKGWTPPKDTAAPPKKVCSVKGCGRAHAAKGFCMNHYQAARRGKPPTNTAPPPAKAAKLKSKRRARRRNKPSKR